LAEMFWRALEESGYVQQIFAEEEGAGGDHRILEDIQESVNQILTGPPSFADRIVEAVKSCPPQSAAFLYRAGALYPSYRTSALLDDLREGLLVPVVLLYPGRLVGSY